MKDTTDFLNKYHDMLVQEYQELSRLFETGGKLADWQLASLIKESAQKRVFTIKNNSSGERRVLKVVSRDSYENLEQEYRFLAAVAGERTGFVRVYDFFSEGGWDYLVEEYISGSNLQELKEAQKPFSVGRIIQIGISMCSILQVMHSQNPPLIHRDITPTNIIQARENSLYLIDLGIARQFEPHKERDTVFIGTEATAPPEQYGYAQTDARTDIYSLGMLLLYLATGSYDARLLDASAVPEKLKKIILKCIEFAPDRRYASVLELKKALTDLDRSGIYTENPVLLQKRIRAQQRKNRVLVFLLAVCLVCCGCMAYHLILPCLPYHFQSPEVEAVVRDNLGLAEDAVITRKDLQRVHTLYLYGSDSYDSFLWLDCYAEDTYMDGVRMEETFGIIDTLEDFRYMTNLTALGLCNQKISDLTPLAELPLEELYVSGNNIVDVSALSSCTNLRILCLSRNPANDYAPLGSLCRLTKLTIAGNSIENLDFLAQMKLQRLILQGSTVMDGDFTVLEGQTGLRQIDLKCSSQMPDYLLAMPELENVNLFQYPAKDMTYLRNCSRIRELHVHYGGLESLEGLENLPNLVFLNIEGTQVSDLAPIMQLGELSELWIDGIEPAPEVEEWAKQNHVTLKK